MRSLLIPVLATLSIVAACSQPAVEDTPMPSMTWSVDSEASILTFVSVKNTDLDEEHEITGIAGSLTEDGDARIELDMSTLETFIPIRNERMAEHLFETADYPVAVIEAELDYAGLIPEAVGTSHERNIDFVLNLRGIEVPLSADVRISWLEESRVRVETIAPIMVEAAPLNLVAGIETLRGLAGLESIEPRTPVSFSLEFRR